MRAGLWISASALVVTSSWTCGACAQAPVTPIPEVVVTASRLDLIGLATTASQGSVTKEELDLRPAYRVGQLLESTPGLVVTVHSGEGKANQYLARGFNLDHGTDVANFFDDMPINRSTNAHGQGYSDLNFIIPELASGLDYTKGTYYPSVGDFGAVASEHLKMANSLPDQMELSAGTLGDYRAYLGGTQALDDQDRVLAALDLSHVDGPFTHPDNFRKTAAALRFSHGAPTDGYDLTVLYYHGLGSLTTDQPLRAVQEGLIDRYGTLDPSDGTRNERLSVSGHYATRADNWQFTSNLYYVHSRQTLFNDFTHFLDDPINGDQEQQDEDRNMAGGGAALKFDNRLFGLDSQTTFGVQGRYDSVFIDRRHTDHRKVLDYCEEEQPSGPAVQYSIGDSACSADRVQLGDVGLYVENATRVTPWFRWDIGAREEYYAGHDDSLIPGYAGTANVDASTSTTLFQPQGQLHLRALVQNRILYQRRSGLSFRRYSRRASVGAHPGHPRRRRPDAASGQGRWRGGGVPKRHYSAGEGAVRDLQHRSAIGADLRPGRGAGIRPAPPATAMAPSFPPNIAPSRSWS